MKCNHRRIERDDCGDQTVDFSRFRHFPPTDGAGVAAAGIDRQDAAHPENARKPANAPKTLTQHATHDQVDESIK